MMRFDRFTERAQEVAQRAAEVIQRYKHTGFDRAAPRRHSPDIGNS